jgi:hypothetical protein
MELKYAKEENKISEDVEKILDQKVQEALAAIAEKKYGQKYWHQGRTVVFVGIGVYGRGLVKAAFGENFVNYLDVFVHPAKKKIRRSKPVSKRKN